MIVDDYVRWWPGVLRAVDELARARGLAFKYAHARHAAESPTSLHMSRTYALTPPPPSPLLRGLRHTRACERACRDMILWAGRYMIDKDLLFYHAPR